MTKSYGPKLILCPISVCRILKYVTWNRLIVKGVNDHKIPNGFSLFFSRKFVYIFSKYFSISVLAVIYSSFIQECAKWQNIFSFCLSFCLFICFYDCLFSFLARGSSVAELIFMRVQITAFDSINKR